MVDTIQKMIREKIWELLTSWNITPPKPMFNITAIKGSEFVPKLLQYVTLLIVIIAVVLFFRYLATELRK